MNLLFCFKMVSEFSFYFILGNYFATQMKGNGIPLPLCLLPPLAVALCRLLNSRKNKWERLPLLLCLIGLFTYRSGYRSLSFRLPLWNAAGVSQDLLSFL